MGQIATYRQSHFAPAFFFLSAERRQALGNLYQVCRVLDDAVDVLRSDGAEFLDRWKRVFVERNSDLVAADGCAELAQKFLDTAERFGISMSAMTDLIEKGVAVDLKQNRFQTAMDTEGYCFGVAGTVGLACLSIFGVPLEEAKPYAVRLGIAIQWVNILRDVGVDAALGRIYLPLDHLEQFGYTERDVFDRRNSAEFQKLIQFEADVAKSHFKRASELLPQAYRRSLLPARIMGAIYQALLVKIETKNFPVLDQKIKLNFLEKLSAVWTALRQK